MRSGAATTQAIKRANSILQGIEIDRAIGLTLVARGWTVLSGVVSLLLMTRCLSPIQQGYYYTFTNILALQVFFELGLSTVIIQFASHERAGLQWSISGLLEGAWDSKSRLASLLRLSILWYSVVALLVLLVVLPAGYIFFHLHPTGDPVSWQLPWLWIVIVTAGSIAISPLLAVLEGCGLIAEIAAVQVVQNVIGSTLFWAALLGHWGLFTAPITNTVMLVGSATWLLTYKRGLIRDLLVTPVRSVISWKREIWPLQWRVALSWLSGYFITQIYTLVLFAYHGPVAAGQMGLSLGVMTAISAIALAWVTTKSAYFGTWIAQGDFVRLDRVFFSCLWQSLAVSAMGGLLFWGADFALNRIHHPLAHRLLAPEALLFLVGATIIGHIVTAEAIYLRAHKQEPFLWLSLVVGALTATTAYGLGRPYGAVGMLAGTFGITLFVALSWGTWIFVQKRSQWHKPLSSTP